MLFQSALEAKMSQLINKFIFEMKFSHKFQESLKNSFGINILPKAYPFCDKWKQSYDM